MGQRCHQADPKWRVPVTTCAALFCLFNFRPFQSTTLLVASNCSIQQWDGPIQNTPVQFTAALIAEKNMRFVLMRSLILTGTFLLALPPGWCCMVPYRASTQRVPPSDKPQNSACCKHHDTPSTPPTRQAPKRTPLPYGQCPCSDHSLFTDASKVVCADLALPAPLPLIDEASSSATAEAPSDLPIWPLDNSLQLIHCVWLC